MALTKLLVDTDIGTDCDDAVCLSYLLREAECELMGIATVGRDATVRAQITEVLCRFLGQPDVPIAAGADQPFFDNYYWWGHTVNQAVILEEWPATRTFVPNEGVDLMRRVIRENPGEVVLLSLGPMTNVALLAAVDPEAVGMLKAVYTMTGRLQYPGDDLRQECNTMLDPAAAGAALQRHLPNHRVIPIVAGQSNSLTREQIGLAFPGDELEPLRVCCGIWADRSADGGVGLHDPRTGVLVFQPELATYERGRIGVKFVLAHPTDQITFERDQVGGALYLEPDDDGPHEMATSFQTQAIVERLVSTIAPDGVIPQVAPPTA